jgi:hypothetical protein
MDHPSLIAQSQYQVKAGTLFCQGNAKIPGIDFNGSLPFCVGDTKKRPRSFKILYAATPPIHLRLQVFSPEKKRWQLRNSPVHFSIEHSICVVTVASFNFSRLNTNSLSAY